MPEDTNNIPKAETDAELFQKWKWEQERLFQEELEKRRLRPKAETDTITDADLFQKWKWEQENLSQEALEASRLRSKRLREEHERYRSRWQYKLRTTANLIWALIYVYIVRPIARIFQLINKK